MITYLDQDIVEDVRIDKIVKRDIEANKVRISTKGPNYL